MSIEDQCQDKEIVITGQLSDEYLGNCIKCKKTIRGKLEDYLLTSKIVDGFAVYQKFEKKYK